MLISHICEFFVKFHCVMVLKHRVKNAQLAEITLKKDVIRIIIVIYLSGSS